MEKLLLTEEFGEYNDDLVFHNTMLSNAINNFEVFLHEEHYVSESASNELWIRLKSFFAKIILSMKDFIKEIQIRIESTIREKQLKEMLKTLHTKIKLDESMGKKEIEMVDLWLYKKVYLDLVRNLRGYTRKFANVKYTKTWQIEDDLNEFDKIIEDYKDKMDETSKKMVKVPIKKALNFVEDELRGKSDVTKTLNDAITEFQEMQRVAENLKTKMGILGADVIPRHVGFIQKMATAISNFIRRCVTKFVMTVVFVFA